jgi:hypothetical protein
MIVKFVLFLGLTSAAAISIQPAWLAAASKSYEICIFKAIDQQYETGRFSETNILSDCAAVRRTQVKAAESAAARTADTKVGKALISHEFARLDQSVWTIIGHLRERHDN